MKHKTLLWISAALTTLVLLLIAGVVFTVRQVNAAAEAATVQDAALAQPLSQSEAVFSQAADPANQAAEQARAGLNGLLVTPAQAAEIAAQYLGRSDLYAVESTTLDSTSAYLVTFSSGDQVYISLDGQVMAYSPARQVTAQNAAPFGEWGEHEGQEREHAEHEWGEHEYGEIEEYGD